MYRVVTYQPHIVREFNCLSDAVAECRRLSSDGMYPDLYAPGGTHIGWRDLG